MMPTTAQHTMIHYMLLTNEEEVDDGVHSWVAHDDPLDDTQVDDGAHSCITYDDPLA